MSKITNRLRFFDVVFLLIALATFRNSYWSASFVFDGNQPSDFFGSLIWVLFGAFFAFCVDFGMFKLSQMLQRKFQFWPFIAYSFAALISIYLQIIYASYHTSEFVFSTGVNVGVMGVLSLIINLRLIVLPVSLPLFSVIYTLANSVNKENLKSEIKNESKEIQIVDVTSTTPNIDNWGFECKICGKTGSYGDEISMRRYAQSHLTRVHKGFDYQDTIKELLP